MLAATDAYYDKPQTNGAFICVYLESLNEYSTLSTIAFKTHHEYPNIQAGSKKHDTIYARIPRVSQEDCNTKLATPKDATSMLTLE